MRPRPSLFRRVCPPSLRAPHARTREAGFTLIELLVGMVILTIVLLAASRVLLNSWAGNGKSVTAQSSNTRVLEASDRIRQDLLVTGTHWRSPEKIRDADQLQIGLMDANGRTRSQDPADNGAVIDVRDVYVATPTDLVVRADVNVTAGTPESECLEYRATALGTGWQLQRSVWALPSGACASGGGGAGTVVLTSKSTLPNNLFQYRLVCNNPGCITAAGCNERPGPANVTGAARNWITSVTINLDVVASHSTTTGQGNNDPTRAVSGTRLSIRSRESAIYREALGCS